MNRLLEILPLLIWALCWTAGGMLLVRAAFRLGDRELLPVGLAGGLAAQVVLTAIGARWLPFPLAAWVSSSLILLAGLSAFLPILRCRLAKPDLPNACPVCYAPKPKAKAALLFGIQALILLLLTLLFTAIGRGTAIFDDYAHLPVTSMLAAGDVPPHFPLNPGVPYNYHYFLMLLAAQMMRLGDLFSWAALDLARGLSLALALLLGAVWAQRLTRSLTAAVLTAIFLALAGGTRWIFLLLPPGLVENVSTSLTLMGSGASSAATFARALWGAWGIDGAPPIPFPFAFVSGILHPGVLGLFGANGAALLAVSLALLLTASRWQNWKSAALSTLWIASLTLLGESIIVLTLAAWGLVAVVVWGLQSGKFGKLKGAVRLRETQNRLTAIQPGSLASWLIAVFAGTLLGLLLGSGLTEPARTWLLGGESLSYQTVRFHLAWPPALVSAHLGELSLLNPAQLLAAALEIGPLLLALPLVIAWGWRAAKARRWYEAVFILAGLLSLGMVFVRFSGSPGVRNTSRLYGFISLCVLYAVPLGWIWLRRQRLFTRVAAAVLGLTVMVSGGMLLSVELSALNRPVYSDFITDLDARMARSFWNKLPENALVFDPTPSRPAVLFGRATDAGTTWFERKPGWLGLLRSPSPQAARAAGFDYFYMDRAYWEDLAPKQRALFEQSCVVTTAEFIEPATGDFRRLLDQRGCQP